jgi:hypothetical protein
MAERQRDLVKERFWREVLARQASSGLSGRAFCRQEQLAEPAFYAWRRTIALRDDVTNRVPPPAAFVPVVVTDRSTRDTSLALELAGGRVLRLPQSIPIERLAELIVALESRGGR